MAKKEDILNKPHTSKKSVGRPTLYNPEIVQKILDAIATNTEGETEIYKKYPDLPDRQTVREWRWRYPEFAGRYALAKQMQAELMAEELEQLSKKREYYFDSEGNKRVDTGEVQGTRMEIDTRKWLASKLAPKVYGDQRRIETLETENEQLRKELLEHREALRKKYEKEY